MRRPCRNEDCVSLALGNGVTLHPVFLKQPLSQMRSEVDTLVVDRVVVGLQLVALLHGDLVEEVPDLVGVPRMENVPQSPDPQTLAPDSVLHSHVTSSLVHRLEALTDC